METSVHSRRRKQRLIDPEFQQQMILRLGGISLFYFLMCLLVAVAVPMGIAYLSGSSEEALAQTAFRLEVLFKVLLVPLLVTFAALWVHGIQETFRIAGPNFRFKAVMTQMQSLVIPRGVRTRKNDLLQDTAREFDQALIRIHDLMASLKAAGQEAAEATRSAAPGCTEAQHQQAVEATEELASMLERVQLVGPAPTCAPLESHGSGQKAVEPQEESVLA